MLSIRLAFRNLFRNTRRTILTCTLLGLGLTALIFTDGLVLGMKKMMVDSVTSTLQGEFQIHHVDFPGSLDPDKYLTEVDSITSILLAEQKISGYAVRTLSGGMVSSPYNMSGAVIYGIDPGQELGVSKIAEAVTSGHYLTTQRGEILLGSELADQLEINLGDRVVLTLAEVDTGEISQSLFRLSGIVHFGLGEIDKSFAFVHIDQARDILGMQNEAHEIAVRFVKPEISRDPDLALRRKLDSPDRLVRNWLEFNPEFSSIIEMSQYSTAIIGGILFLLVSLGVINSMFMSIYERIYEFGVVRAIGTSSSQLMLLVFWEALILALLSAALGLIVMAPLALWSASSGIPFGEAEFTGIAITSNIFPIYEAYQFFAFPIYVVVLTLFAAIYPAIYAGRIIPSEALHRSL